MRVAVIGFWHVHGDDYMRDALAHPGVEVVALWDDDAARGEEAEREHGVPFRRDLDELLADPAVEGVIVTTSTASHADVVVRSARAGKHVFMEKVLARRTDDAARIVDAAREAGITLVVSMRRSDRGFARQIAKAVADGAVGDVTAVRVQDGHPLALPQPDAPGGLLPDRFYDPVEAQGGALIDLCHPVYLVPLILGMPRSVVAVLSSVTGRDVDDNAAVLMSYADGAIATVQSSYVTAANPFVLEVHGTRGSILYSEPGIGALIHASRFPAAPDATTTPDDTASLRIWTQDASPDTWQRVEVEQDGPDAFAHWVELAEAGRTDEGNLRLALQLTALIAAAYDSTTSGGSSVVVEVERPDGR